MFVSVLLVGVYKPLRGWHFVAAFHSNTQRLGKTFQATLFSCHNPAIQILPQVALRDLPTFRTLKGTAFHLATMQRLPVKKATTYKCKMGCF